MINNKLVYLVAEYETKEHTLKKIKTMYENGEYEYIGGSLIVPVRNLVSNRPYVIVDINNINECYGIDADIQYYASMIYTNSKDVYHTYYKQAEENIKTYEGK